MSSAMVCSIFIGEDNVKGLWLCRPSDVERTQIEAERESRPPDPYLSNGWEPKTNGGKQQWSLNAQSFAFDIRNSAQGLQKQDKEQKHLLNCNLGTFTEFNSNLEGNIEYKNLFEI